MRYLLISLFVISLYSCNSTDKNIEQPNILWITHEDLSPIYGCYGDTYAHTPNIDALAKSGYLFRNAYSNAPICAPARSTLITGMYATSLGTQNLRSEIPVPQTLKILPEVLSEAGYYTTNNVKTDYNFSHEGRWDESSKNAHWRNRPKDKPFFSVFNFMITHEGPTNALRPEDTEELQNFHNPLNAKLPPQIPESDKTREIWAHLYDLTSVFDIRVGELIDQLKEDGLYENTIIFVFSDHGHGLPGHKRWLENAGLHVPFILHVPEKYKHLVTNLKGPETNQMVGFVDFAPTVIHLAGAEVPKLMEGKNFLGKESKPKEYIFGYRDRADDCYDMARSVFDGQYLYVRHYMPFLPYYQNAVIFNKGGIYTEINRLKKAGQMPPEVDEMFTAKPVEQLFDLKNDPLEKTNIIDNIEVQEKVEELRQKLNGWMLDYFDTGLFNEGDMMLRAKETNTSTYQMARNYKREDFAGILEAANLVGMVSDPVETIPYLKNKDAAIRYWALVALKAHKGEPGEVKTHLIDLMKDENPVVRLTAAEIMVQRYDDPSAYQVIESLLKYEYEPVVLQAAIACRLLGEKAAPLLPAIQNEIMPKYSGEIWGRYKSWSYPMFIGMALDQTQLNCGLEIDLHD